MKDLSIDIEVFSDVDLARSGVYRYAESESFEILLFGYSVDGGPVRLVDLTAGEKIPEDVIAAMSDPSVKKWAFNAMFERVCLSVYLKRFHKLSEPYLNPEGWFCTMVWSGYLGLPMSLAGAGSVLGLDKQKMSEGKDLIRYFCLPCKATKSNGGRTRNMPADAPDKWEIFKLYNIRDVETEQGIQQRLKNYPVPDFLWDEYHLDQEINDRGILIDMPMVENALRIDERCHSILDARMRELTGLENPNSVLQLKQWLSGQGLEMESLGKKEVAAAMEDAPEKIRQVLALRQQISKSSVKKYTAMQTMACADSRARGMFRFYKANRTGRFASAGIQMQNLARNEMPDLTDARELVRTGNFEGLELLYDNIPNVLSELIRTAFIPSPGKKFIVADFSAIEARVLSYLAGETWRTEMFANGGDIYCMSASQMFKVPVEKHGINGHLRQKGKIAELACIAEGQLVLTSRGEVPIEQVRRTDKVWDGEGWVSHDGLVSRGKRSVITYGSITATPDHLVFVEGQQEPVQLGYAAAVGARLVKTADSAATDTAKDFWGVCPVYDLINAGKNHRFTVSGRLVHNCGYGGSTGALISMGALEMGLQEEELKPLVDSWRAANPHIVRFWGEVENAAKKAVRDHKRTEVCGIEFFYQSGMLFIRIPSGRCLSYVKPEIGMNRFGSESITFMGLDTTKHWSRIETFGGRLTENIVQAVSRDILCNSMMNLRDQLIVAHVHDEIIIEADRHASVQDICGRMARTPAWLSGMPLKADGYECEFYMKS